MTSYVVAFECPPASVAARGRRFQLEGGLYFYVGSCGVGCLRVLRHLAGRGRRRPWWHVDFLPCRPLYAVLGPAGERQAARCLASRCSAVRGFGSSDDPEAAGHLFSGCALGHLALCLTTT